MIGILIWLIIGILVIFEISPWLGAIFILAYLFLFIIKIHKDFGGDAPIQVQKKDICEIHELSYENGQIQTRCNYINGVINGPCECWYENGQIQTRCNYINGVINGPCERWYENGQKEISCNFINGKIEELCESWYKNGQIQIRCNYVNGVIYGPCESWYENGQKEIRCKYINGEIFEVYEFYYDDGQTDNTISHQRRHLREIANSHHQTIKEKAICPPL